MDFLFAKTSIKNELLYKLLAEQTVYADFYDLQNAIPYDPQTSLEDEEIFVLDDFASKEYCPAYLKERFASTTYAQMPNEKYNQITYLLSVQEDAENFFFQRVSPSMIYEQPFVLWGAGEPNLVSEGKVLFLKKRADALFIKSENKLYFRDLSKLTSIFDGIEELYRISTPEETRDFLNLDFIRLDAGFNADNVNVTNRKLITGALKKVKKLTPTKKAKLIKYIRRYSRGIVYDEASSSFAITNDKQLKELLYGIDERYYKASVAAESRVAKTISKLSIPKKV